MFTGIIEEIGTVDSIQKKGASASIDINCRLIREDLHLGDSIAVNGVCLTASAVSRSGFTADIMHETLNRSSLSALVPGSHVNLERAMSACGRFGGHIVSGHIDGIGVIEKMERDENAVWISVRCSEKLLKYIVEKGSIAIDGISLTVAKLQTDGFSVSVIPHTLSQTVLSEKRPGSTVNLENDCIGKYVERLLTFGSTPKEKTESRITEEFLIQNGF